MYLSGDLLGEKNELGPSSAPLKTIICLPAGLLKKAASGGEYGARRNADGSTSLCVRGLRAGDGYISCHPAGPR